MANWELILKRKTYASSLSSSMLSPNTDKVDTKKGDSWYLILLMNEFCVHEIHGHSNFLLFPNAKKFLRRNYWELSNNICFSKW